MCPVELKEKHTFAALAVSFVLYLSLALPVLRLPGLQYDEVLFVNAAIGRGSGLFIEWAVQVGGVHIPMMLMRYIGALKAWLYAPIFAIFGTGPVTVRLPVVLLGLLTLTFTWLIARRLFGRRASAFAVLLLATDPTFIFCNRLDWGPLALSFVLKTAGTVLVLRWLETGGASVLMGAGFLFGLGLFDKVTFVWFIAAMAIALPLCFWQAVRDRTNRSSLLAGLAGLLLGAAPLLSYNLIFPARSIEGQKRIAAVPAPAVLGTRVAALRGALDGTEALGLFTGRYRGEIGKDDPDVLARRLLPTRTLTWQGWLVAAAVAVIGLRRKGSQCRRQQLFVLMMSLLIIAMVAVSAQATGLHHVLMLYPLPQLLIASVLADLGSREGPKGLSSVGRWMACAILIVAFIVPQMGMAVRYLWSFERGGGRGFWSDAIYRLADFALRNPERQLKLMEWGFWNQLQVLGGGRIRMQELFPVLEAIPDEAGRESALRLRLLLDGNYYVFHHPRFGHRQALDLFARVVRETGVAARVVQVFSQRDGEPLYVLYEVVPPEVEALVRAGGFYRNWEAEDAKRTGGGMEEDVEASRGAFLGDYWGRSTEDDVVFEIDSGRAIKDGRLRLRFDREAQVPREYVAEIDRRIVVRFWLPPTRPPRVYHRNWSWAEAALGDIPAGRHELRLRPAERDSTVLIDTVTITEGPIPLPTEVQTHRAGMGYVEDCEVLGFKEAPQVRLEVSPAEVIAGKDELSLRVRGLDVSRIDMLYEVDGRRQPPLYDWQLDEHQSTRVAVDAGARRGLYRYLAIRDSSDHSPTSWIRINTLVRVK